MRSSPFVAVAFVSVSLACACGGRTPEATPTKAEAAPSKAAPVTLTSAEATAPSPAAPSADVTKAATHAEAPKATPEPPPKAVAVLVDTYGLHIGGGPNDTATKAPFVHSVEPHFPELASCFAKAEDTTKGGDFGVDLLVAREGGKAKVTLPRTAIPGEAFRACVVDVFSAIEFERPKYGATMASYAVRFRPKASDTTAR
jgi:hypothetical protein